MLVLGLCLASEVSLAETYPDRQEVRQALNESIGSLAESNATENEIIAKLNAIITGPVVEKQLNDAWSAMYNFSGGNWMRADRRLKQAADMMGYLSRIECLRIYNSNLTPDNKEVNNDGIVNIPNYDKDCPSREEVKQTLNRAIGALDESNATEKEIILKLNAIIAGPVSKKQLNAAWSAMYNFSGSNWNGTDRKLKQAADMIGHLNRQECLASYNEALTLDGEYDSPIDDGLQVSREEIQETQQMMDTMLSSQKRQSKAFLVMMAVVLFLQCILMFQQIQIKNKI